MTKQRFKLLPNGDVEGIQIFPSNDKVIIKLDNKEISIGEQKPYEVVQIIKKDKIKDLFKYLNLQHTEISNRIKSADDVIEKTSHIDIDKMKEFVFKLSQEKLRSSKKLQELNNIVKDYYMKCSAIDNKKILEDNLKIIDDQLQFLIKLV